MFTCISFPTQVTSLCPFIWKVFILSSVKLGFDLFMLVNHNCFSGEFDLFTSNINRIYLNLCFHICIHFLIETSDFIFILVFLYPFCLIKYIFWYFIFLQLTYYSYVIIIFCVLCRDDVLIFLKKFLLCYNVLPNMKFTILSISGTH